MNNEIWKPIKDINYQVSNLGRVKGNDYYAGRHKVLIKGKIIKPRFIFDYLCITLRINKKYKRFSVAELVAKEFIDNPNNFMYIRHKDKNKRNCVYSNLDWFIGIPVNKLDENKNIIKKYENMYEIIKEGEYKTNLKRAILEHYKLGGFYWEYSK